MNEYVKIAIRALHCHKGDNAARARNAFLGQTPEQMLETWGQSGETKASILAGYENHERECNDAIEWLTNMDG